MPREMALLTADPKLRDKLVGSLSDVEASPRTLLSDDPTLREELMGSLFAGPPPGPIDSFFQEVSRRMYGPGPGTDVLPPAEEFETSYTPFPEQAELPPPPEVAGAQAQSYAQLREQMLADMAWWSGGTDRTPFAVSLTEGFGSLLDAAETAAQTVGGVVVGSTEWLTTMTATLGAGAYAQYRGMDSKEAIEFGQHLTQTISETLKDKAPEVLQKYIGRPDDPMAKELLVGMGELIEATVGRLGSKAASVVGGALDEAIKGEQRIAMLEGRDEPTTAGKILMAAKPWAEYLTKFGTELATFKGAHAIGKTAVRYARQGKTPPTAKESLGEMSKEELANKVEEDFNLEQASKEVGQVVKQEAKRSEGELTAERKAELRRIAQQGADATQYQRELAEINSRYEQGEISLEAANALKGDLDYKYRTKGQVQEVLTQERALIDAVAEGTLPEKIISAGLDEASGAQRPFATKGAVRMTQKKLSEQQGIITRQRRVPGKGNGYVLEVLEQERTILSSRGKPYTQKGARRRQTQLRNEGIETRIAAEGSGYKLEVTSYSPKAAAARRAELTKRGKSGTEAPVADAPARAQEVRIRTTPTRPKTTAEKSREVEAAESAPQTTPAAAPRSTEAVVEPGPKGAKVVTKRRKKADKPPEQRGAVTLTREENAQVRSLLDHYFQNPSYAKERVIKGVAEQTGVPEAAIRSIVDSEYGFLTDVDFMHSGIHPFPGLQRATEIRRLREAEQRARNLGLDIPEMRRSGARRFVSRLITEEPIEPSRLEAALQRPTEASTGRQPAGRATTREIEDRVMADARGWAFEGLPEEVYAGIPIRPETAKKINDAAIEAGKTVTKFLQDRYNYPANQATLIADTVAELAPKARSAVAVPKELKDTDVNRGNLRKEVKAIAESEGLLVSKPTTKGKKPGEFKESEWELETSKLADDLGLDKATVTRAEMNKLMKKHGRTQHKVYNTEDFGFDVFIRKTLGKQWSKELTVDELRTVKSALLGMRKVKGEHPIRRLGPGGRDITEYHLDVLGKLLPEKAPGKLEATHWSAERLEKAASGYSEIFFWPFFRKWKKADMHFLADKQEMQARIKEMGLTRKDAGAIGRYAISRQEAGARYLDALGLEVKPLTPKQMEFYNYMRGKLEGLYNQINRARAEAGREPLPYTEHYFSFFRDMKAAIEEGLNLTKSSTKSIDNHLAKAREVFFRHAKKRVAFSELPIAENAFKVMENYMSSAHRYIQLTPELSFTRALIEGQFNRNVITRDHGNTAWPSSLANKRSLNLKRDNPEMYKALSEFTNYIAGMPVKGNGWAKVDAVAAALNKNLAYSILGANLGSMLRQFGAWRHAIHATSMRDMIAGISDAGEEFVFAKPGTRLGEGKFTRGARAKSQVLSTRTFDATVQHILETLEGKRATGSLPSYLQNTLGKASLRPLMLFDEIAAVTTWHAAMRHGARKFKLKGEELIKYADRVVLETQGSGHRLSAAPIMRQPMWRSVFLFQTYVLNEWNYLTRRVLGYKTDKPSRGRVGSVLYYVMATTALSSAFEAMGINSPFPTPITAFNEVMEKTRDPSLAAAAAAFELVEPVPIIGGAARFGAPVGGPIISLTGQFTSSLHGDPFVPHWALSGLKMAGVPGTNAMHKLYRQLAEETDSNLTRRRRSRRARR